MNSDESTMNTASFENRRRFQNRMAQRKFRQKVKAQRGHSFSNQHDNVVNSVNIHYLNTPSSDAGLELPIVSGPDCNLQGQDNDHFKQFVDSACWISPENQSFTNNQKDNLSFTDHNQVNLDFELNQYPSYADEPPGHSATCLMNRNCRAFELSNSNLTCSSVTKRQAAVVQSQRMRICDQAEQYLEKALSLYDFGVSLDILADDSNLRSLLINASIEFHARRFVSI